MHSSKLSVSQPSGQTRRRSPAFSLVSIVTSKQVYALRYLLVQGVASNETEEAVAASLFSVRMSARIDNVLLISSTCTR